MRTIFVSKKKYNHLLKRIADLEGQVQKQKDSLDNICGDPLVSEIIKRIDEARKVTGRNIFN